MSIAFHMEGIVPGAFTLAEVGRTFHSTGGAQAASGGPILGDRNLDSARLPSVPSARGTYTPQHPATRGEGLIPVSGARRAILGA